MNLTASTARRVAERKLFSLDHAKGSIVRRFAPLSPAITRYQTV